MRETAKRKRKVAFPMRDDGSKNENTVSRRRTGVLKTVWDFPDAGQANRKPERDSPDAEQSVWKRQYV